MRLSYGATCFWTHAAGPLPETDVTAFHRACFAAARQADGRVADRTSTTATPNFHTATIICPHGEFAVLCHAHLPLTAFAAPLQDGQTQLTFTDPPAWAYIFEQATLRVLTLAELTTPVEQVDMTDLAEVEHEQIRSWNPTNAGEVLFNWWD